MQIQSNTNISAIYYALLQCGYEYAAFERDADHISAIGRFRDALPDADLGFFREVRQDTCEAYPYWPRAAALETATHFLSPQAAGFNDFDAFRQRVMSASNISDAERGDAFWAWVKGFPAALAPILDSAPFQSYLHWQSQWLHQQGVALKADLALVRSSLDIYARLYGAPIRQVCVILDPIKCVYASDYFLDGEAFYFSSGALSAASLIHELSHPLVHPQVAKHRDAILRLSAAYPGVDASYYLSGNEEGRLNAFEEHMVRRLTQSVLAGLYPPSLEGYLDDILRDLA